MKVRIFRIAAWTLGILALLSLLTWIAVPRILRSQLTKVFASTFTESPSLGRISFNPLTLTLSLENFRLPGSGEAAASFERLRIGFDVLSPFRGAITFRSVELERPEAHLALLGDGTLNLARLLKPQPAPAKAEEPPSLRFLRIAVTHGLVEWQDRTRTPMLDKRVDSLNVTLHNFRTRKNANNDYQLEASTPDGEHLAWRGTFILTPPSSAGHIGITALRAHTLDELLGPTLPFRLAGGEVDLGAHYAVDAGRTPAAFALDSLDVTLRDFALAEHGSDTALVVVSHAATRGGHLRPDKMQMNLGSVSVEGVRVLTWLRNDGHLNLEHWGQPVPGAPADTAGPWTITADTLAARAIDFTLEDRRLPKPARFHIAPASVSISGLSTAAKAEFPVAFACSTGAGGFAHAEGTLGLTPPVADLALGVEGFDLRVFQPYIDAFARLELTRGAVHGAGRLHIDALGTHGPLARYRGEVSVHDLQTRDLDLHQDFVSWKRLNLKGLDAAVLPTKIAIHEIEAVSPYLRAVVAPDRTTNFQQVMTPPGPPPAAFTAASTDTPQVSIERVRVSDGSAYFSDLSLRPGFTTGMQGLTGTITGLSSVRQSGGAIEIAGQVDRYAPVTITGSVDPLGGAGRSDLHLDFKHIDLTSFTPYSGRFAGYRIREGKLSLNLRYQVEGKKLLGENKVFIEQFKLGERVESPDATHLPVRFAIALLKDKDGNIDLDIPVHGDLDDPKFSLGRVILKVLLNLIVKAVSSPFHLLGALVGGGGDSGSLDGVEFDAGQTIIDAQAEGVIAQLAKALAARPALRLEIEEAPDVARDSTALAFAHYQRTLAESMTAAERADSVAPGSLSPEARAALIERAYVKAFGPLPKTKEKRGKGAAADSACARGRGHSSGQHGAATPRERDRGSGRDQGARACACSGGEGPSAGERRHRGTAVHRDQRDAGVEAVARRHAGRQQFSARGRV